MAVRRAGRSARPGRVDLRHKQSWHGRSVPVRQRGRQVRHGWRRGYRDGERSPPRLPRGRAGLVQRQQQQSALHAGRTVTVAAERKPARLHAALIGERHDGNRVFDMTDRRVVVRVIGEQRRWRFGVGVGHVDQKQPRGHRTGGAGEHGAPLRTGPRIGSERALAHGGWCCLAGGDVAHDGGQGGIRHHGKALVAGQRIEGMQHAIVGAEVDHPSPAGMLPAECAMPGIEHEARWPEQLHMRATYGTEDRRAATELRWLGFMATHAAQVAKPEDAVAILAIEQLLLRGSEAFHRSGTAVRSKASPCRKVQSRRVSGWRASSSFAASHMAGGRAVSGMSGGGRNCNACRRPLQASSPGATR